MITYVQYLTLPIFLVLALMYPGGENATVTPGNTCMHATDCVVESYIPMTITRAGDLVTSTFAQLEVYAMLGLIGILGLSTGFIDQRSHSWRPMYIVMFGTVIALLPGIQSAPTGSLLIPFMPPEVWVAVLAAAVSYFGGAFRLTLIAAILGFCFSKLAFMSSGSLTFWLFVAGVLLVIFDHIISSFTYDSKQKNAQTLRKHSNQNNMIDGTHDLNRHVMQSSTSIDFGENLQV